MSSREKLFLIILTFASLSTLGYHQMQQEQNAALHLPGGIDANNDIVHVAATAAVDEATDRELNALKACVTRVAQDLSAVATYLHCAHLPPVFVVHRRDLEANEFEDGNIEQKQGLMVRLNVVHKDFDQVKLQRWILRHVLLVKSYNRFNSDSRGWVLDGFCEWWVKRDKNLDAEEFAGILETSPISNHALNPIFHQGDRSPSVGSPSVATPVDKKARRSPDC